MKPGYRDDAAKRETGASDRCNNITRWLWYLVCGVSVSLAAPAVFAYPVLWYSDLDSGPVGAYVTVWGKGFGATAGGVKLGSTPANIVSWRDTKVEFGVPANSGNGITLQNTIGQVSNGLPFTTRSGGIFFVSKSMGSNSNNGLAAAPGSAGVGPWRDLSAAMSKVVAGDVVYVRAGSYPEVLKSSYSTNLYISGKNGTAGFPIAIVAYPGESATIGGSGSTRTGRTIFFEGSSHDWTIAKFTLTATSSATQFGGAGDAARLRLIGNTASGVGSTYGTLIVKSCSNCKILGNHIYNSGTPGNKLAHLIYYGGYGVGNGLEIAWNLLHDELGGRCIQVYGHLDGDRLSGLSIHDNIVYNCPYDGILVGASDAAYKPWISDAAVYNNIVYNTGGGIRIDNPGVAARVLHNTLHDNSTSLKLEAAKSAEARNNILSLPTSKQVTITMAGTLTLSHNGYQGTQAAPPQDTNPTIGDPLFANASGGDFSLKATSPFMNKGSALNPVLPKVSVPTDPVPDLGQMQWMVGTVPY